HFNTSLHLRPLHSFPTRRSSDLFGRRLPDKQITEYLRDDKRPRHIQHALVQIGERIMRRDTKVAQWYPELVRLSTHLVEEVRNTDRKSTRLNSSHLGISYAVFCL